jgi:uncharacterized repeat protein (TIGR03803 family)
MRALNLLEILRIVFFVSCIALPIATPAQSTFTVLANFDGIDGDGANPYAGLIQATDGNFYGTTGYGGASSACGAGGCGTIFKITAAGTLTTLHSFDMTDGAYPKVALVQGTDRNFYGTTLGGGAHGNGTFFKITATGKLTTIYNFEDSSDNSVGLVQGTDRNFYGTSPDGGASSACTGGCGTVFKISPEGKLTTLHSFDWMDGFYPHAGLIQGTDGNFYGTTLSGGNSACDFGSGCGTVFKITPAGQLTTLHSFDLTDGSEPSAPLVQARSGNFYGTTLGGGANLGCESYTGCGTVFEMTPAGKLTTLYSFESAGFYENLLNFFAVAGLVQGTDGNFYGTTYDGGNSNSSECLNTNVSDGCGTVFKITPGGTLTTLYSFGSNNDAYPLDGLVQGTDGSFYGTTWVGGETNELCEYGCGTVFSISVGLSHFVKTNPTSGKVGTRVTILGNNLAGVTSVTFNGTTAKFRASSTYITTRVPTDATTGTVEVVMPRKTLKSNVPFRVLKGAVGYSE